MNERPDPDQLLKQVQAEEQAAQRGKLKLFFGACAGVGKTYAMLEAARQRKAEGVDVVVGLIETHNRKDTAALLEGLEQLPRRTIDYSGTQLKAFDLDAAIARHPQLILVDELAHTNEPGSRHTKRWQDVWELLDHGIDVYTTLNVQHLETMNDVVAQITGVTVRETVPDSVFERADEIGVVDLPPDDLLKRLAEGKVYMPELAQRALQHFFKKSNLAALREIALRITADRINAQVQTYRQSVATSGVWATAERLLVCIGSDHGSLHLVRAAHRMARSLHADWVGVYVETPAELRRPDDVRARAVQHLRLAEQLGAETVTLSGEHLAEEILTYARSRNVTIIIVGKSTRPWGKVRLFGSSVEQLLRRSGDIHIFAIRADIHREQVPITPIPKQPTPWSAYRFALLVVLGVTALNAGLFLFLAPANLIMIYLVGVMAVALRAGYGPSVIASVLSVLAFDFFFIPPRFKFAVSDSEYILTFLVMLAVGLIISNLTNRLRKQTEASRLRERRTTSLYELSRELASNRGTDALLQVAVRYIGEVFESQVVALLPNEHGRLVVRAGWPTPFAIDQKEQAVAQWVHDLGQIAGKGTDTLPASDTLYVPMMATGQAAGALGVRPKNPQRLLIPDQLHLLETFAHQTGLAIENDRLAEEQHRTHTQIETERLRNVILSSIPHDLRTPLAAITGSATSLVESGESLDAATRKELAQNIAEEAERLSGVVNNVLDLTKLESGTLEFHKELQPIEEVLGAALSRLEKRLVGRAVETRITPGLPMVRIDARLIEQVFMNLFDNALKYTPAGSLIEVSVSSDASSIIIEIADRGPGLPGDEPDRLFEKFYRGEQKGREGFGLGLTICRGIIEAHGGHITAENRPEGGAVFRLTLPIGAHPPLPETTQSVDD